MVNEDLNAIRDAVRRVTGNAGAPDAQQSLPNAQPAAHPPPQTQPRRPPRTLIVLSALILIILGVGSGLLVLSGGGKATTPEARTEPVRTPNANPFMPTISTNVPGIAPTEMPAPSLTNTQQPAQPQPPLSPEQQESSATQTGLPATQGPVSPTSQRPPKLEPIPQAPEIVGVSSYTEGVLVYLSIRYTDADSDAEGFGTRWLPGDGSYEEHPFSSPSYGRVFPGRVDYPFNHACGEPNEYESDVEAWIYDGGNRRSESIIAHLSCS